MEYVARRKGKKCDNNNRRRDMKKEGSPGRKFRLKIDTANWEDQME